MVQWTDDREADGARLEIVCTPKGYRGFESHSVRQFFVAWYLGAVFLCGFSASPFVFVVF